MAQAHYLHNAEKKHGQHQHADQQHGYGNGAVVIGVAYGEVATKEAALIVTHCCGFGLLCVFFTYLQLICCRLLGLLAFATLWQSAMINKKKKTNNKC